MKSTVAKQIKSNYIIKLRRSVTASLTIHLFALAKIRGCANSPNIIKTIDQRLRKCNPSELGCRNRGDERISTWESWHVWDDNILMDFDKWCRLDGTDGLIFTAESFINLNLLIG